MGIPAVTWTTEGQSIVQYWIWKLNALPDHVVIEYGKTLYRFSNAMRALERYKEALGIALSAAVMAEYMLPVYNHDGSKELELADIYAYISEANLREFLTPQRALDFAREAVKIYRKFPDMPGCREWLCYALWDEASILGEMEKYDEATIVWKEIADLTAVTMADQLFRADTLDRLSKNLRLLQRHDEAAETRSESAKLYHAILKSASQTEAEVYFSLSVDFSLAGNFPKGVEAIEASLSQYRALAFKEDKHAKDVAKSLNQLVYLLIMSQDYERAFIEGLEVLRLCKSQINEDPEMRPHYIRAFYLNSYLCEAAADQEKSEQRSLYILDLCRQFVDEFPNDWCVFGVILTDRARLLAKFQRLEEGCVFVEQSLALFRANPVEDASTVDVYINSLIEHASLLDHQGFTERALRPMEEAIKVGMPFVSNSNVAGQIQGSMHRRAQLYCELGRYNEAVTAIEETLAFAREHKSSNVGDYVGCLEVAAMSYQFTGRYQEAIDASKEAIELCKSDDMKKISTTKPLEHLHYPQCLQALSENLACVGKDEESLMYAQKAVDEATKLKDFGDLLAWTVLEPTLRCTQFNLAFSLLFHHDGLSRALDLIVEARTFYEVFVPERRGSYTVLAAILRAEGIIACAFNKHEEGDAARQKLTDLQRQLRITFPSLADMVEVELEKERNLPSWKRVIPKLDLKCQHQAGIL
ncbi:hypothetical protein CPC08DRAFT_703446 [Agrocybe pediades]|nr:hypothetical protein CPC08DRAFT_703446 [Agrocybe pediades]